MRTTQRLGTAPGAALLLALSAVLGIGGFAAGAGATIGSIRRSEVLWSLGLSRPIRLNGLVFRVAR